MAPGRLILYTPPPMPVYDLHSHSIASDGSLTPTALVARAQAAGVDVLALTDHDTTAGLDEAARAAQGAGITLVAGTEVSVSWGGRTVHIVGLGVDAGNPQLAEGLGKLRDFRAWRAEEIGRRLAKCGIDGAYEGARELAKGELISRTHFARFLVDSGHAKSVRDVFKKFLVNKRPGHVPGEWEDLQTVVGWIRAAGGQAVIAHPARYGLTRTRLLKLIDEFRECGGEGMEVVSGSHSADECLTMAAHARSSGMLASVGSDYHGPENPYVELGRLRPLPEGCEPVWAAWGKA